MKTVIMAGGKGTRITSVARDIPKPMIKVGDRPILEHEIDCLREQGYNQIIITVSHLGNVIMEYFGDGSKISPVTGEPFGVDIEYYFEREPLGNAGALFEIKDKLTEEFFLLNADSLFNVDFRRMERYHKEHSGAATILTHPNSHPYDSGLIITDRDNYVEKWFSKEEDRPIYYKNRVNSGIHILKTELLEYRPNTKKVDLDRQILKPLAGTKRLVAYDSPEYIRDMGTPERYNTVCNDWISGLVQKRNLLNKQKAILLDRDGTINEYVGFLTDINDFKLISGVANSIRLLNDKGYLVIVITNQPVIARGEVTLEDLEKIHNKMETLLGEEGAYIDGIYYCPHHPDKGFVGEVQSLKKECFCRKPKPGMLIKAAEDFNLELSACWMVGDGKNDILAGKKAGTKTALIGEHDYGQDITVKSLRDFVEELIGNE